MVGETFGQQCQDLGIPAQVFRRQIIAVRTKTYGSDHDVFAAVENGISIPEQDTSIASVFFEKSLHSSQENLGIGFQTVRQQIIA